MYAWVCVRVGECVYVCVCVGGGGGVKHDVYAWVCVRVGECVCVGGGGGVYAQILTQFKIVSCQPRICGLHFLIN